MLYLACDHAGLQAKNSIIKYLTKHKIEFTDLGVNTLDSVNYALKAKELAVTLQSASAEDKGVLICGTGIGMSIAVNKFNFIRGALCYNVQSAVLARRHNDANVLILKGRHYCKIQNNRILKAFLTTQFDGGRHIERVASLKNLVD